LGVLLVHITKGADATTFQPMNVNFGLFPPLETETRGRDRKKLMAHRAIADIDAWLGRKVAAEEFSSPVLRGRGTARARWRGRGLPGAAAPAPALPRSA